MKKMTLPIAIVCILAASVAVGGIYGGSNFGSYNRYPDHTCRKPFMKPVKPYNLTEDYQVRSYNAQVDQYNDQLKRYSTCIDDYIENASNDIQTIKQKVNDAVNEANRRTF